MNETIDEVIDQSAKDFAERFSGKSQTTGSVFNYVNVVGRGCEGWLNLFFGDDIIALVNNVELANKIRKTISERKPNDMDQGRMPPKGARR